MKKKVLSIFLFMTLIFCLFVLSGCSSTDKDESYIDTSKIAHSTFEYDSDTNTTEIVFSTTVTNNTIYDITGIKFKFDLYNGSSKVGNEIYTYYIKVKHGSEYTGKFRIVYDGEITSIEYKAWTAKSDSFWNSYKVVLIITIVLASVASLIYICAMIFDDMEFGDFVDFIQDNFWIVFVIFPIAGGLGLWGWLGADWVSPLILVGGIVAVIVVALLAQLIKYVIEAIIDAIGDLSCGCVALDRQSRKYNYQQDDYYNDDSYESLTVADLKDACRARGLTGYSSMRKMELISLLEEDDSNRDNNSDVAPKNIVSTKKKIEEIPSIRMDDIAGLNEAKEAFNDRVILPIKHREIFEKYDKKAGGGILLYGLPGTGKTMFAQAVANELNAAFFSIKCSDIMSKWYGESESNVKQLFAKAKKQPISVIFFDEFDSIGRKRMVSNENNDIMTVQEILAQMQGVEQSNNVLLVLAATNCPWNIDSALMRPGRFNDKIYIPLPDYEARLFILNNNLKNIRFSNDVSFEIIANRLDGYNSADIVEFCDQLKILAIKEEIKGEDCILNFNDIDTIFCKVHSSISPEDVERMNNYREGRY